MKKKRHIGLWIALALVFLAVLPIVGLQPLVNTRWAKDKLNSALSSAIDGELDYSRLDISIIKDFPAFRVALDSVSLTYPHERFACWDSLGDRHPLLTKGRGAERDTLASFDRLAAAMNLWELARGRFRVKELRLEGLDAFLHFYDSTASNLDIFLSSGKDKEKDTAKVFSTPFISVGELCIPDLNAVYTDQSRSMYASASLQRLSLSGRFRFDESGDARIRGFDISLDSLAAAARIPSDSAVVSLPKLNLSEPYKNVYDLGFDLLASASTGKWGDLVVPASLDGRIGLNMTEDYAKIVVPGLDGRLAHIPLHLEGNVGFYDDSTLVNVSTSLKDCPLDTLLSEYGVKFAPGAGQIDTDAHIDIEASAEGEFAGGRIPRIEASVKIPQSRVAYIPLGLDGSLVLDVEAALTPRKVLNASINELKAILPGIRLTADASGKNILSGDPELKLAADASFAAESLMEILPEGLGVRADGNANLSILAKGKPTDFVALDFDKVSLDASLSSDRLAVRVPKDTVGASLYRPDLRVVFGEAGGDILITTDSLSFSKGDGLEVRARTMRTDGMLSNVETRGGLMPHLSLDHSDSGLSLRTGNNWFLAGDVDISAGATKRGRLSDEVREKMRERMVQDSLERSKKSYHKDRDFEKKDIKIALDTTIQRYIRQWDPTARVSVGRGAARMPSLPLRTRVGAFKATFDGDVLGIDSLSARLGTSDIDIKGEASGLRGFLRGRGDAAASLDMRSRKINANEILAAFSVGQELSDSSFSETDDSFVVDTLAAAVPEEKAGLPLLVLPGNVSATVNVLIDTMLFSDYSIHPVQTLVNMRERTAQMQNTVMLTDLGNVKLSAFYSSRNRQELAAGVDVGVYGVSADSLKRLLPSIDTLMPVLQSFHGRLNCELTALTQLDTNMTPDMSTLEGVVRIRGKKLEVEDAGSLKKITRLLQFSNPNIGHIDDLNVDAVVHDNKIDIFPFVLGVDRYRMALHGMQRLDRSMYYHASVLRSPFIIRFGVNLFGNFDKWGFTLGLPKYNNYNVPDFSEQIDTMQTVMRRTIDNVFDAEGDMLVNSGAADQLKRKEEETGYEPGMDLMKGREAELSEELAFEYDAMLEEEKLQSEVDAILEESYRDITDMMRDYEDKIYDKKVLRKMEKLEKEKQ